MYVWHVKARAKCHSHFLQVYGISPYHLHDRCRTRQISFSIECRKSKVLSSEYAHATPTILLNISLNLCIHNWYVANQRQITQTHSQMQTIKCINVWSGQLAWNFLLPKCKRKSICSVIHIQVTYIYNVLIFHVQNHKRATEPTFSQFWWTLEVSPLWLCPWSHRSCSWAMSWLHGWLWRQQREHCQLLILFVRCCQVMCCYMYWC